MIRKGFNVPVGEVEAILARHPRVREVAVDALPKTIIGKVRMVDLGESRGGR